MEMGIFSVYDGAAEQYMEPWFARNDATARRSFGVAVNEESHNFQKFPDDFVLFRLGTFNGDTGVIDPIVPVSLGNGLQFVRYVGDKLSNEEL